MCESWRKHSNHEETFVKVTQVHGEDLVGFLYACDPETGNIALLGTGSSLHIVFSENISEVAPVKIPPGTIPTTLPSCSEQKRDGISADTLLKALRSRHITAKIVQEPETHVSLFDGAATISSPFLPENCRSTNENVLMRVRQVLADIYRSHKDKSG